MKKYKQLTQMKRYQIYALIKQNLSITQIANNIGVHRSTISRELKRNSTDGFYSPEQASVKCFLRHRHKKKAIKLNKTIQKYIRVHLKLDYSPEQIAGRLKLDKGKFVLLKKTTSKEAKEVAKAIKELLSPIKQISHTITSNNGKEFAYHEDIAKELGVKFYFCDPYSSWQRGLNENTNGLVRRYIPKGSDFSDISDEQIRFIQDRLNHRPRKTLGYLVLALSLRKLHMKCL